MPALPDAEGLFVAWDSETSGLHPDSGGRIAVVSYAFREPVKHAQRGWYQPPDAPIRWGALAFDQGLTDLPLGEKVLLERHLKRIGKTKPIEAIVGGETVQIDDPSEWFYRPSPNVEAKWWDELMAWFARQRLQYWNAKFDMTMAAAGLRGCADASEQIPGGFVGGGVDLEPAFQWDGMLVEAVLKPQYGVALKSTSEKMRLARRAREAGIYIADGTEAAEAAALAPWVGPRTGKNADPRYDLIPWEVMGGVAQGTVTETGYTGGRPGYAAVDAILTLLAIEEQGRWLDEFDGFWWSHIDRQFDLMRALYRMERRGVGFDTEGCYAERDRLEITKRDVAGSMPFDPTPAKARVFFFGDPADPEPSKRGLGAIPRTDKMTPVKREPQVDEEVIRDLAKHANQEIATAARQYELHEGVKSAISKWYQAWPDLIGDDGRLRVTYNQGKVVSGRLSASRVQLQAIPHDYQIDEIAPMVGQVTDGRPLRSIREFFEPKRGFGLWEFDVANAEPRIATMIARCQPMYDGIMVEGNDTHTVATLLMFAGVMGVDSKGNEFGPDHADWTMYRQVGKRCNLGILYAAGPAAIREQIRKFTGVDYPEKQVRVWVEAYRSAFPQFVRATEWWSRFAEKTGYVRLINGRLRYFQVYEPIHKAFNQVIQGSVAETITDAMIEVERQAMEGGYADALLLQTHDSMVMELPDGAEGVAQFAAASAAVRLCFEKAFRLRWRDDEPLRFMEFPVDAKAWGRTALTVTKDDIAVMQAAIDTEYERQRPKWARKVAA